jgi:uncharacterized circularly permuted ATP-grasp superfamily protein
MNSHVDLLHAALCQRVRLYERLLADAYGAQQALREGWYAGERLWGAPGYLRGLHGVQPLGHRLHAVRFEVGATVQAFVQGLPVVRAAPLTLATDAHTVVLKATWDDPHALGLAQSLHLPCVPHTQLQVSGRRLLWLDAPPGQQVVQLLLRTADDDQLDPLELGGDPAMGVPGLTQLLRTGNVQVLNFPGAGWLQAPWVEAQRAALCEAALGEAALGERAVALDARATPATVIVQRSRSGDLHAVSLP